MLIRHIALLSFSFLTLLLNPLTAQLVINEVMSSNFNTISDEDGQYEDWIELYNAGPNAVSLLNYSLSDDISNPQKWIFPDIEMAPNSYILVWASDKNRKPTNGTLSQGLNRYVYSNIGGTAVSDLTSHPNYPDFPDIKTVLSNSFSSPINVGDDYGQRIFGYLIPEQNGDHQFSISGDDNSELYLSTDDNPQNLQLIASVPGWSLPNEWDKYSSQNSKFINLQAGKKYLIQALMKEGGGGDHVIVRWRPPGKAWETPMPTTQLWIENSVLHTNFKLSASGETLALYDDNGQIIDKVDLPALRTDVSYGRYPNGIGDFKLLSQPTPEKENIFPGYDKALEKPTFSHSPGIYNTNIVLEILHTHPGATIIYTLDGSIPHANNGRIYTQPLNINSTVRVRAIAMSNDALVSEIVAGSFSVASINLNQFESDLPLMVIHQFDTIINNFEKQIAYMTLVDQNVNGRYILDDRNNKNYRIDIEIRGSSSQSFPKNGYGLHILNEIGTNRKVNILGMPEEHNWVLHGPFSDKSLIRNHLAYELAEDMGHYAPRTRLIELFLHSGNGQLTLANYHGVYLLVERIKIAPGRLDLQEIETYHSTTPEITGGYIFKNDRLNEGETGLTLDYGQNFAFVRPNEQEITEPQKQWLKSYLEEFNRVLNGQNFTDPTNGYKKFIDDDTFIDYHLHTELLKQIDGFRLSTFMHIDRNDKLKMGPVWDYNLSWGNADYLEGGDPRGWYYPLISREEYLYGWYNRLFQDPSFEEKYKKRYSELRQNVFSNEHIIGKLRQGERNVKEASVRNFQRWNILGRYVWPNFFVADTHEEEIDWMENWMKQRLEWMDTQLLVEVDPDSTELIHYWNFNNSTNLTAPTFTLNNGSLQIEITENAAIQSSTGQGFNGANARAGDEAGSHLRVNNPIGSSLLFSISTDRYKDIKIQYESRRSGSGANRQYISYSKDGNDYIPYDTLIMEDGPILYTLDMSAVQEVNNNKNLILKIDVDQVDDGTGGNVGNNRWDNFTVEGTPLPNINQAPTLLRIVEKWDIIEGSTIDTISFSTLFSDPEGEPLNYSITVANEGFLGARIAGNNLVLTGKKTGETQVTLTAQDAEGLSINTTIPIVIYPTFCLTSFQDCTFDTWDSENPEYSYPSYMIFLQSKETDPTLNSQLVWPYYIPHSDYASGDSDNVGFPYKNSSRTRINGLGQDGISMINTGRNRDLGATVIHINTQNVDSLYLSFTAGTFIANSRVYSLRLQYQVGLNTLWKDVLNSEGEPIEYLRQANAPDIQRYENIVLPAEAIGKDEVFVRWLYYFTGERLSEDSGARDMLTLDDIIISKARSVSTDNHWAKPTIKLFPNPVADGHLFINQKVSGRIYNNVGHVVATISDSQEIKTDNYPVGVYILKTREGQIAKFIIAR